MLEQFEQDETTLRLGDDSKAYLYEAARWGKFLSIVGFVMIGILALFGLFFGTLMSKFSGMGAASAYGGGNGMAALPAAFSIISFLLVAVLYFFPTFYLFQFSNKSLAAVRNNDSEGITEGLKNLKSMFKFMGILMAIILGFYALIIVFSIIAGLFA
jgi:hypothetical protein